MPSLKKTSLPAGYAALAEDRKAHGEINDRGRGKDCTVVAIAIATGLSYATVHEALIKAGRVPGRGCFKDVQARAIESLGFTIREWETKELIAMCYAAWHHHKKNVAVITTHHPRRFPKAWAPHRDKALLLYTRGHVSAMVGGVVQDWAINRSKRVYAIWEITRKAD